MKLNNSKINLHFYASISGNEPVRDWLRGMAIEDRHSIGLDLQRVQYRWPVGMPLCKSMGNGLWEVRTSLPKGNIARVFICFFDGELWALHGFIKKTQKTPINEMEIAKKRKRELENG